MMKAIILAAGRGSRMGAMTAEQPKCLTPLAGHPLLHWQMKALKAAGVSEIGIVGGYKKELLAPYVSTLFANERWAETNMVVSLTCAQDWLRSSDCIISYSDIFYDPQTIRGLAAAPHDICISYDPNWLQLWSMRFVDPLSDAEQFKIDANNRITAIGARVTSPSEIEGQYMGLLKFSPRGWNAIEAFLKGQGNIDRLDMTSMLSRLIGAGQPIYGVKAVGAWGEVDAESDLRIYEDLIAKGQLVLN